MNRPLVDRLVSALLYEGYLLYPYRPSVKNRQRWSFGGLYPPSYTAGRVGADASAMRTQCLATGSPGAILSVSVRYLHLVSRLVGALDRPRDHWPIDESSPLFGLTAADLEDSDAEFVIMLTGVDELFAQSVHSRMSYKHDELVWGAKLSGSKVAPALVLFPRPTPPAA